MNEKGNFTRLLCGEKIGSLVQGEAP